jgi:hypothetical protein
MRFRAPIPVLGTNLEIDPAQIERAELYFKAGTGGAGTVTNYFALP